MLAAETAEAASPIVTAIGQILAVVLALLGTTFWNWWNGKKKDTTRRDEMKTGLSEVVEQMDARFDKRMTGLHDSVKSTVERIDSRLDTLDKGVQRVESFCIGPDGKNGFRGEIAAIKSKIEGFEQRDRERLEAKARRTVQMSDVGSLDRRAASSDR